MPRELLERELCSRILGAFYDVYNYFGYGLPEVIYSRALELELTARGLLVAREAAIEVKYKGEPVGDFRADLIVDSRVILELKAIPRLGTEDEFQLLNYLRASGIQVGLLLHFGPRADFRRLIATRPAPQRGVTAAGTPRTNAM